MKEFFANSSEMKIAIFSIYVKAHSLNMNVADDETRLKVVNEMREAPDNSYFVLKLEELYSEFEFEDDVDAAVLNAINEIFEDTENEVVSEYVYSEY